MRATAILTIVALAAACNATGLNLPRVSAHAIQPTPNPDSVKVSDVHVRLKISTWVATTPTGVYDCSIAGDERTAICARRDSPR